MDRDSKILSLRGLVYKIAASMQLRHGGEFEELVSDGWLGAIDAVDRYDPQHGAGATLATFAGHRIRGAMLDGMRDRDHLTVAQRRGVNDGRFLLIEAPLSLDVPIELGVDLGDAVVDVGASSAVDRVLDRVTVAEALARLPARQAFVIHQRYWKGRTLSAIATDLNVSGARVCQLAAKAQKSLAGDLPLACS